MTKANLQGLAKASNHILEGQLNLYKGLVGEVSPTNLERNFSGFLVRNDAITFRVDIQKVKAHIALWNEQLLIAKFVDRTPTLQDMEMWLQALNQELRDNSLSFCMNMGKGFFFSKERTQMPLTMP